MKKQELTRHYKWVMKKTAVEAICEHDNGRGSYSSGRAYQVRVSDGYGLVVRITFDLEDGVVRLTSIWVNVDYMGHEPILSIKNFDSEWREKIIKVILTWI